MKRSLFLFIALSAILMAGCGKDDGYSLDKFWIGYGTVEDADDRGEPVSIRRDDGALLRVAANKIPYYTFDEGDRVLMHYTILDDAQNGYLIRLNDATTILCKEPVLQSAVTPEDHVGEDPIEVGEMWFGGKYLNVDFGFRYADPQKIHYINLVVDDQGTYDDDKIHLILKHSAEGDEQTRTARGLVSFDLTALIPEGAQSVDVMVHWTDYHEERHDDEGTFTPYGGNAPSDAANLTSSPQVANIR